MLESLVTHHWFDPSAIEPYLDLLGERGAEHEGLPLAGRRHVVALNDATDLGLEAHVQHSV